MIVLLPTWFSSLSLTLISAAVFSVCCGLWLVGWLVAMCLDGKPHAPLLLWVGETGGSMGWGLHAHFVSRGRCRVIGSCLPVPGYFDIRQAATPGPSQFPSHSLLLPNLFALHSTHPLTHSLSLTLCRLCLSLVSLVTRHTQTQTQTNLTVALFFFLFLLLSPPSLPSPSTLLCRVLQPSRKPVFPQHSLLPTTLHLLTQETKSSFFYRPGRCCLLLLLVFPTTLHALYYYYYQITT